MYIELHFSQRPTNPGYPETHVSSPIIVKIVEELRRRGHRVQVNPTTLYSYQGGHGSLPPSQRPTDWGTPESFNKRGAYSAHDGDLLICIAAKDRYGTASERKLLYLEYETEENAERFLLDNVKVLEETVI